MKSLFRTTYIAVFFTVLFIPAGFSFVTSVSGWDLSTNHVDAWFDQHTKTADSETVPLSEELHVDDFPAEIPERTEENTPHLAYTVQARNIFGIKINRSSVSPVLITGQSNKKLRVLRV